MSKIIEVGLLPGLPKWWWFGNDSEAIQKKVFADFLSPRGLGRGAPGLAAVLANLKKRYVSKCTGSGSPNLKRENVKKYGPNL